AGAENIIINGTAFVGLGAYDSVSGGYTLLCETITFPRSGGVLIADGAGNSILLTDWGAGLRAHGLVGPTPGAGPRAGTADNENIDALAGNDTVLGMAGDDTLLGNSGDDSLNGGSGNDSIDAGSGTDTVQFSGSFGNDTVTGGEVLVIDGTTLSGEAS